MPSGTPQRWSSSRLNMVPMRNSASLGFSAPATSRTLVICPHSLSASGGRASQRCQVQNRRALGELGGLPPDDHPECTLRCRGGHGACVVWFRRSPSLTFSALVSQLLSGVQLRKLPSCSRRRGPLRERARCPCAMVATRSCWQYGGFLLTSHGGATLFSCAV